MVGKEILDAFFKDKDVDEIESKDSFAFDILQELIDDCILDVAFEMHRQAKTDVQTFQDDSNLSYLIDEQGYDIFGQNINTLRLEAGKQRCLNCNAMFPVKTYAKHFSKCLGLIQGRTATRNVSYTDDELNDKFSVFNFPEGSSSSSFMSDISDIQESCVTSSSNSSSIDMFPNGRRVIKNTYSRRRTIKQIQDKLDNLINYS